MRKLHEYNFVLNLTRADTNGDEVADQKDEKTPVKWQILKQEGDDLFLLADQVLDAKAYNEKYESVTWETSTLRTWMNGEFYDTLFTDEEKKAVKETEVKNEVNPYYGMAGGNDTKDHMFLLSLSDIWNTGYGFLSRQSAVQRDISSNMPKTRNLQRQIKLFFHWQWL